MDPAPGVRIVAALRAGALLGHRPGGVVHVVTGATTATGQWATASSRPACGVRTRRLAVVPSTSPIDLRGARFCRRCTRHLPPVLGRTSTALTSRDQIAAAYADLTIDDLRQALAWARDVDDAHGVGYLALLIHGPAPVRRPTTAALTPRWDLEQALRTRLDRLRLAALTPEERLQLADDQRRQTEDAARIQAAHARGYRMDRITDRRNRGQYVPTWDRDLIRT
ncbi:hypothetical protein [Nocardioides bruguierae]|uniref:Uncharacterized protein n=1 Tax=Nocardioides bruguierae TaxID=2945102 RepID=A0A9X2D5V7_9ACTN|nr:hypothetical protein [Nocardioides bruguierae]MCM0619815.1 hypothetical protein [Nocardioides bruguierae]